MILEQFLDESMETAVNLRHDDDFRGFFRACMIELRNATLEGAAAYLTKRQYEDLAYDLRSAISDTNTEKPLFT